MATSGVLPFESLQDRIVTLRADTATKLSLLCIVDALEAERVLLIAERSSHAKLVTKSREDIAADRLAFEREISAVRQLLSDEQARFEAHKSDTMNWIADAVDRVSAAARALEEDKRAVAGAVADHVPLSYLVAVKSGAVLSAAQSPVPRKHLRIEVLSQSTSPFSILDTPDNSCHSLDRPVLSSSINTPTDSAEEVLQQTESINKRRDAALDHCIAIEELASSRARTLHAEEVALRIRIDAVRKSAADAVAEAELQRKLALRKKHEQRQHLTQHADSSDTDALAFRLEVAGAVQQFPDEVDDDSDSHLHIIAAGDGFPRVADADRKAAILRRLEALGSGKSLAVGAVQTQVTGADNVIGISETAIAVTAEDEDEEDDDGGTWEDTELDSTAGAAVDSARLGVRSGQLEPSVRTIAVLIARDQAVAQSAPAASFGSRLVKQVSLMMSPRRSGVTPPVPSSAAVHATPADDSWAKQYAEAFSSASQWERMSGNMPRSAFAQINLPLPPLAELPRSTRKRGASSIAVATPLSHPQLPLRGDVSHIVTRERNASNSSSATPAEAPGLAVAPPPVIPSDTVPVMQGGARSDHTGISRTLSDGRRPPPLALPPPTPYMYHGLDSVESSAPLADASFSSSFGADASDDAMLTRRRQQEQDEGLPRDIGYLLMSPSATVGGGSHGEDDGDSVNGGVGSSGAIGGFGVNSVRSRRGSASGTPLHISKGARAAGSAEGRNGSGRSNTNTPSAALLPGREGVSGASWLAPSVSLVAPFATPRQLLLRASSQRITEALRAQQASSPLDPVLPNATVTGDAAESWRLQRLASDDSTSSAIHTADHASRLPSTSQLYGELRRVLDSSELARLGETVISQLGEISSVATTSVLLREGYLYHATNKGVRQVYAWLFRGVLLFGDRSSLTTPCAIDTVVWLSPPPLQKQLQQQQLPDRVVRMNAELGDMSGSSSPLLPASLRPLAFTVSWFSQMHASGTGVHVSLATGLDSGGGSTPSVVSRAGGRSRPPPPPPRPSTLPAPSSRTLATTAHSVLLAAPSATERSDWLRDLQVVLDPPNGTFTCAADICSCRRSSFDGVFNSTVLPIEARHNDGSNAILPMSYISPKDVTAPAARPKSVHFGGPSAVVVPSPQNVSLGNAVGFRGDHAVDVNIPQSMPATKDARRGDVPSLQSLTLDDLSVDFVAVGDFDRSRVGSKSTVASISQRTPQYSALSTSILPPHLRGAFTPSSTRL